MKLNRKYRKTLVLLIKLLGIVLFPHHLWSQSYGLKFGSHEVTLDKRTELDLSPDAFLKFHDEFEISFDYKTTRIYTESNSGFFGYVFRVINKDDKNVDLLSTPTPIIGLNLVVGQSNSITPASYPVEYINNWINLRIKFVLSEDRLIFYTPDTFFVQENIGFNRDEQVKIIFGVNDYKQFKNSDVPSMTIKDLKISEKGKLKYHWLLNEKEGGAATDKIRGKEAKVLNPIWVTLNHQNWQKVFEHDVEGVVCVTSDTKNGEVFIVGEKELTIYSTQQNNFRKVEYKNTPLFFDRNYRAVYNSSDNKIYCYVMDKGPYYALDPESGEWDNTGEDELFETRFRHHNSFYNEKDNSIYLFGGYGLHRYNNEIVKISLNDNSRTELPTNNTDFPPRYLAGSAALNDTFYILGGYGSESGNQLINPQSYFDLIAYSIKDSTIVKRFDIPRLIDDMIVGNSFWINKQNRDFYALVYSKIKFEGELQLIKGNLDSPEVKFVADKIPFKFLDIRSWADLFYMPTRNKLYAFVSYTSDSNTQVSIYAIDNPPGTEGADSVIAQKNKADWYLYAVLAFLLLFVFWILIRRKKRKESEVSSTDKTPLDSDANQVNLSETFVPELPNYNLILFGGFQVFNKELEDITNKFSPLLKELFLLILLHTYKNNKGISSDKITEILWYDKSEKSARNNRSVNIAKLRTILEEISTCELTKKTGYWKINFQETETKSDYFDFLRITASKKNLTKQAVNQLIEVTQKGAFLSNLHYDWLDEFKAMVSDTIIDTLVDFAHSCDIKKEADFIVHLSDSIFNFDMINEDAMILKCKAQYWMGKHSHAKATYEKFFKEYLSMYGQEYDKAFLDILEIKE